MRTTCRTYGTVMWQNVSLMCWIERMEMETAPTSYSGSWASHAQIP